VPFRDIVNRVWSPSEELDLMRWASLMD